MSIYACQSAFVYVGERSKAHFVGNVFPKSYSELSATPGRTGDLVRKYHDRLLFGTDADANLTGRARELNDKKVKVMKAFYEGSGPSEVEGAQIYGLDLPEYMLENIYYNNALRFMKKA